MNTTIHRCHDGGTMCTDCEAQGRCMAQGIDFADSQRAALYAAEDARIKQRQVDRLVNWGFTALIVGFGVWAVFA